ncbi:coq1 putative hexaprenyl diphosphate synthase [Hanseniaspora guilliermondii]
MVSPTNDVVTSASKLVNPLSSPFSPLSVVSNEMETLTKNITKLIGSGHPVLNRISGYYFEQEGKKVRPLLVLLLSKALAEIPLRERNQAAIDRHDIPGDPVYEEYKNSNKGLFSNPVASFSPLSILHGIKQATSPLTKGSEPLEESIKSMDSSNGILPKQRRLAEIVEMIHTASLLHDDVIDFSDTRRGRPSGNIQFSNKMAVLAGDFLLGRSVVAISRLRNPEVIELVSNCIANLVEGEFMQLKNTVIDPNQLTIMTGDTKKLMPSPSGKELDIGHDYKIPTATLTANIDKLNHETLIKLAFDHYLHKTYLKTASLISKSLRSTAILSGCNREVVDQCYEFGKNIGICFQLVDDMLDYTQDAKTLGKPANNDLKLGLATAPVLFAWKMNPNLKTVIEKPSFNDDDIKLILANVYKYDTVSMTRKLATEYRDKAVENLRNTLPKSRARDALEMLTMSIMSRSK